MSLGLSQVWMFCLVQKIFLNKDTHKRLTAGCAPLKVQQLYEKLGITSSTKTGSREEQLACKKTSKADQLTPHVLLQVAKETHTFVCENMSTLALR